MTSGIVSPQKGRGARPAADMASGEWYFESAEAFSWAF